MRFHIISLLLAVFMIPAPRLAADAAEENAPGSIVQATVTRVIAVLTDGDLSEEEKRAQTYDIAARQIDFTGMSRRILAVNWKRATEEQRTRFEKLFRKTLLSTYWNRIRSYSDEKVKYVTGMIEGNRFATVDTVIISDKIEIPITYRMELVNGSWMAYDFLIESLSLVTRYRTEYRNLIKTRGVDGLLAHMSETQGTGGD